MTIIPDLLRSRAREFPDNTAVQIEDGERRTFKELDVLSSKIANLLLKEGLKKQDKVSCAIPNAEGIYYIASYFGTQKAGGVFVPVNVRYSREEVEKQLTHSDTSFLLAEDGLLRGWGIAGDAGAAGRAKVLTLSRVKEMLGGLSGSDPEVQVNEDDPAELIYTSGTTGIPKGVMVTHHAITSFDETPWVQLFSGRTALHPVPLYTFAGMTMTVLPLRLGMKCILMKRFDAHRFADLLEKEQVFSVYAVSSMWLIVLKEVPDLKKRDFSNLLFLQFGAAPMPPSAVLELSDLFTQANVINLYGLTESGAAGYMMPFGEARSRPNSVGKPVDENTEIRILDERGNALPPGQPGEILLRSRDLRTRRRYYKDDAATQQVWDTEGWVRTGDIGYVDGDGYLYLVDRKKDVINRGGYKISSLEVEDALFQHPSVKEVAVVGVPHPVLIEDCVAFIVAKEGREPTEEELRTFLLGKLADYKVPRQYHFMSELPKNAVGKVLKRELRDRVTNKRPDGGNHGV